MTTKICSKCKIEKDSDCFYRRSGSNSHLLQSICKDCTTKHKKKLLHTKKGLIDQMYTSQIASSKKRGHSKPSYTKKELKDWLYAQPKFHILFDNWKILGFQKDCIPSIDRKNDSIGYSLSNIQLLTWKENRNEYKKKIKNREVTTTLRAIEQYSLNGDFIKSYKSIIDASNELNISYSGISKCCRNILESSGGFRWQYK